MCEGNRVAKAVSRFTLFRLRHPWGRKIAALLACYLLACYLSACYLLACYLSACYLLACYLSGDRHLEVLRGRAAGMGVRQEEMVAGWVEGGPNWNRNRYW